MLTTSNREILTSILRASNVPIAPNQLILVVWRDREHFEQWKQLSVIASDHVSIKSVPMDLFPMIQSRLCTPMEDRHRLAVCGIAFGEADYSDVHLIYFMELLTPI